MKRNLILAILSITAAFAFYFYTSVSIPSGQLLKEHPLVQETTAIPADSPLNEMVYLPEQSIEEQEAEKMLKNLHQIHPAILKAAKDQGVVIKLFEGKLTEEKGLKHLDGLTPKGRSEKAGWESVPGMTEDNRVYVKIGMSEYGMGHGSVSLELHEFAHAADLNVFSRVRSNPLYLNIWKKEAGMLFSDQTYFKRFPEEYFAEIFAMYYYSRETRIKLKEMAPLSYQFIANLYKSTVENGADFRYNYH
ncbi:anthrax toxin lethal factor-related metalloendopeptidase [Metabacillus indicus]|uniref:anthrax toxin lethal factor-related metalloendopeptidase n=1 Tax=Metabacillus indicus TaxID=246786 RepID=UPI001300C2E9|nr:toxin [Metabacillus indicus]